MIPPGTGRPRRRPIGAAVVRAAIVLAAATSGCHRATVLSPSPGDALREENQKLREEVKRLSLQVRELEGSIAQRRSAGGDGGTAPGGAQGGAAGGAALASNDPSVDAAIPRVAAIQIEGASEVVTERDGPDAPAVLRLWIAPQDGRGRFLQIVGRLHVAVSAIRADADPVEIERVVIEPVRIRDAWRSGLMGTHYAFAVPLAVPPELRSTPLTVTVRFDDAMSGRSFEDQRRLPPIRRAGERAPQ